MTTRWRWWKEVGREREWKRETVCRKVGARREKGIFWEKGVHYIKRQDGYIRIHVTDKIRKMGQLP